MRGKYDIQTVGRNVACIVLTVFSMMAIVACSGSDDGGMSYTSETKHETQMSLHISLGNSETVGTRATPSGDYDDGRETPYENYIDAGSFRVLLFGVDNKYIATLTPESLIPIDGNDGTTAKIYELIGKLSAPLPSSFKVMMLANWPSYPVDLKEGVSTIDDVCTASTSRYAYNAPFVLSASNAIPMFGIKQCDDVVFRPGSATFIGTIHLLRAMAKVEVSCNRKWWTLSRVSVYRYADGGYCAPQNVYDEDGYVKHDYDLDYTSDIHVTDIATVNDTVDFVPTPDGRFIIYLPEYRNTVNGSGKADSAAEIWVEFDERIDKKYKIDFRDYNAGDKYQDGDGEIDIRRNYYYRFNISKADENARPEISLDVYPYEVVELGPVFGRD